MRCALIFFALLLVFASSAYAGNMTITAAEGNGKDKYCIGPCFNTDELVFSDNATGRVYIKFDLSAVPADAQVKNAYLLFRYKGNSSTDSDFAKVYPVHGGWQEDDSQQPGYGQLVGSMENIDCGKVCRNESGWFGTSGYGLIYILNQFLTGTNDGLVITDATGNFRAYSSEVNQDEPFLYIEYEAGCYDLDNDGFGIGDCLGGIDCNDSDPGVNPNATEVCNFLDDDCNGQVDDSGHDCVSCSDAGGFQCNQSEYCTDAYLDVLDSSSCCPEKCSDTCSEGQTRTCGSDEGECVSGYSVCHKNLWSECIDEVLPSEETCNDKDDDCNGIIDDISNHAACGCFNGSLPTREVYDKTDNDCDGKIDENTTCLSRGGSECAADEACPGIMLNGTEVSVCCSQTCSRDCTEGESKSCGISEGACQTGLMNCINGLWGECTGSVGPVSEICNRIDDDCNGIIDDVGDVSTCRCFRDKEPVGELCNEIDDNCDGQIDEGCTFIYDACSDGRMDFDENGTDCGGSCGPCETDQDDGAMLGSDNMTGYNQNIPYESAREGAGIENNHVDSGSSSSGARVFLYLLIPLAAIIIGLVLYLTLFQGRKKPDNNIGGGIDRGEIFYPGSPPPSQPTPQARVNRYESLLKDSERKGSSAEELKNRINEKF